TGIKLGAGHATAIDIDEVAVKVAAENLEVNQINSEEVTLYAGNLIDDEELQNETGFNCYDIVVANILADVIIPLSAVTEAHMKKDAIFITSGIINTKEDEVKEALIQNGFEIIDTTYLKEWVCFIAKLAPQ
ncbi:MAG: 50S ribosomal protein L11 methyltransferase, partial [Lachnospiraceae bacterium]|nr:50S ribosomal protein L11 methyltransferase [Lachnospiraceae bacterium]